MTDDANQLRVELKNANARIDSLSGALDAVAKRIKLLEEERGRSPKPTL